MIKDNDFGSSSVLSRTLGRLDDRTKKLLIKRLKQNKLYFVLIAIALCVGLALSIIQPGIGYQVVVNGEHIGFTKNPSNIRTILASLDQDLRVTKGKDIKYDMDLSFVKGKLEGNKLINADDLKVMVSSIISIRKPAYILKTDEGIAFAIDSKESMNSILDGIKSKYTKGKQNAKADIISTVSLLEANNVPVDKIYNYDQAMSYISSETASGVKPKFDVKVTYTDNSTRTIKRGVTTISDSSMYEGDSRVKVAGSDGIKSVNSKITEVNGKVIDSDVISEKVLKKAVDKVLIVGTKQRIPGVLQIAYNYLGVPYVWGGTSPSGFDCSGLVQYVYAKRGVYLPRTSYEQARVGKVVSRSNLRPGDLCHFPGHVGIYVGNGMMIHAPRPGSYVQIGSIDFMRFQYGTRVE